VEVKGYWGDVYISPYNCFGIETKDSVEMDEMLKKINEQQKYNTLDVSD